MRKGKILLAILLSAAMAVGSLSNMSLAADVGSTGDRLIYDGVKSRIASKARKNEVFSDTRKGLLLQGYGSGSTADFRETFSGIFEIEMKALADKTRPNLSEYRLVITSATTGESFAIGVKDVGTETSAYIIVEEDKAGIAYATDYDDLSHGFTTTQNKAGIYTKVLGAHTTSLVFDPETMEIRIKNAGGKTEYKTVWCLTKEIVDGRRYSHVLESFDYYNVSIEFTQVKSGTKGELLIYNVNGEDYGKKDLTPVGTRIDAKLELQAVAGQEYALPEAVAYGEESGAAISCVVYDDTGKELVSGKVKDQLAFTPKGEGTYYIYYCQEGQKNAGTYVKLQAYKASDINCSIETCDALPQRVGLMTAISIPARRAESNTYYPGNQIYTDIAVIKNGKVLEEKTSSRNGLEYTMTEAGAYTIRWTTSLYGVEYKEEMTVTADESIPGIVGAELSAAYDKETELTIPEANVYLNGEKYSTKAKLFKPSGVAVSDKTVTLDEIGNYRLVYTYQAGTEEKQFERTFQVAYGAENIFTAGEATKIYYDDTAGNADMPGVQIEMSSKNSTAVYAKTLDLSDNTKLDNLIELYVIPNTAGTRDMSGFYITLTDRLNPDNYVSIRVVAGDGNMSSGSYVRIKASGQEAYTGLYKNHSWDQEPYTWTESIEATMAHNMGGYTTDLDFAFASTLFDLSEKTLVLRYDAAEKAIYGTQRLKLVHDDSYRECLIADLDDPQLYKNLWQGFTDDSQVELSISPLSVSGTATFKILSVDGQDLSKKVLADTTAPEVTVDYQGMERVPDGKVGLAYPIFATTATDDLCSAETLITKIAVTHNGQPVEIKDDAFIPERAGTYQIQYLVTDGFGNTTEKLVNVEVKVDVPQAEISLQGAFPETMTYGVKYYAPSFEGTGGSGKKTLKTYYIYKDKQTEFDKFFIPMEEGDYTVVCEVRDYLGQTAKESRSYTLKFQPEILFEDSTIVLPRVLAADHVYAFEEYTASYYTKVGEAVKKASCTIEVTDANGTRKLDEDRLYTPGRSDSVSEASVKFIFSAEVDGKNIMKEVTRSIQLLAIAETDQFMTDYFQKENAQLQAYNRYTVFSAAGNGNAKISYIRPVQVRDFSLVLKADSTQAGAFRSAFDQIRVTLTDKNDSGVKVQLVISKSGNGLKTSINGENGVTTPGSLTTEVAENIEIAYRNKDYSVSGANNADLGKINKGLDGNEFRGFASGEAYVEIELLGVKGDSAVELISINNQTFLSAMQDTVDPQLFVNGSYSGIFTEGTKITLPTAVAYDVLSYVTNPVITVTDAEGKSIKALDGTTLQNASASKEYEIDLNEIGRYTVAYSAEDATGRKVVSSKVIEVMDDEAPTLTLKGKYPGSVKAGKTVKVKKYKLSDNGDLDKVEVKIYYGSPLGVLKEVKDNKIQTKEKGTYTVYYFLTDENGNKNVETFTFTAK